MSNYKIAGYGDKTIGFGNRAAILVVDFQLGFTDPSYAAGKSEHIHSAVSHTQNLLAIARRNNLPVANCNVAWNGPEDMGYWKVTSLYDGSFFKGFGFGGSNCSIRESYGSRPSCWSDDS